MSYQTTDEMSHFEFGEAQVGNIQVMEGMFHVVFDNVKILPENTCNRDIRTMRCNELLFKIENPAVTSVVQEGYKLYDADGRLMQSLDDVKIAPEQYAAVWEMLPEGTVYSAEKQERGGTYLYHFVIDGTDERTYDIQVEGTGETEEWERFLNL